MSKKALQIDSGILQFTPKGTYYEESETQLKAVFKLLQNLFNHDRTLFCLITLLEGTGYAKGVMSHMLLSNPQTTLSKELISKGFGIDYETKVIIYNLLKEKTPRALKNLLMFTGTEGMTKVNNSRTRKLILEYIFDRDHDSLDNLAINYKGKLKRLVRHALGKHDLKKILDGDEKIFKKWIGRYHINALPVVLYLFDKEIPKDTLVAYYKKIDQVSKLKEAAIKDDVKSFEKYMKGLPILTVMGYRNTYKVTINKGDIYEKTQLSKRQKIQLQSASKKSGAKVAVNYNKQDIYDLWKILYHKVSEKDTTDIDKIRKGMYNQSKKINKIDIGEIYLIVDASKSMFGSDKRPLHPFLTTLSIISKLDNIQDVVYVGGKQQKLYGKHRIIMPNGETDLAKGLVDTVKTGAKKIVVISDGYENSVKGMFEHVYTHFKKTDVELELLHINPVLAADAQSGTTRCLVKDISPIPVASYKFLETELIFKKLIDDQEWATNLLVSRYQKLIGG